MPVDAFLERRQFQNFVHRELARLVYFALDRDCPRRSPEILGVLGWIALVGAELVEIIVGGDVPVRRLFFGGAEEALPGNVQLGIGEDADMRKRQIQELLARKRGAAHQAQVLKEFAAIQIKLSRGHVGVSQAAVQIPRTLDQHLPSTASVPSLKFIP